MLAPAALNDVWPDAPVTLPQFAAPIAAQPTGAVSVTPGGRVSVTVTSAASLGPALVTVTVYVAMPPGVYVALPSVFATVSATCTSRVSLSDAVRVGDAGSLAVAVLTSGSVIIADVNATGTVNVRLFPAPAAMVAPVVANAD